MNLKRPLKDWVQNAILGFLALSITTVIFILDLNTFPGINIGPVYCIVILYSWLLPGRSIEIIMATLTSILVITATISSEKAGELEHVPGINAIISIVAIWVCATLVTVAKRGLNELEKARNNLEDTVRARTHQLNEKVETLKEHQELLIQNEKKFKNLLESAPDPILIINNEAKIQLVNDQVTNIFGYQKQEATGQAIDDLIQIPSEDNERLTFLTFVNGKGLMKPGSGKVINGIRKNGEIFPIEITMNPLDTEDGIMMSVAIRDISERTKTAEQLEILVKELHHRVKNNLQLIVSLLNLYSSKLKDQSTRDAIEDCKNSIYSIALVHQSLYQSGDLSKLDLAEYISKFCDHFKNTVKDLHHVQIEHKLQATRISINQAVNFGLILNELLTNACNHAFPEKKKGTVTIELFSKMNQVMLTVSDDGVGVGSKKARKKEQGFGLELVHTLVEQLQGDLAVMNGKGTKYVLTVEQELPDTL